MYMHYMCVEATRGREREILELKLRVFVSHLM